MITSFAAPFAVEATAPPELHRSSGGALETSGRVDATPIIRDDQPVADIIVTGRRSPSPAPEFNLDQQAIETYAASTIADLLDDLIAGLGIDPDHPLILVNGRPASLAEVGAMPVEALESIQILPRGSAVANGGNAGQRAIDLKLKSRVSLGTIGLHFKDAIEGGWDAVRSEATLTRIQGTTRFNLSLGFKTEGQLLEADRAIIQPGPSQSYEAGSIDAGLYRSLRPSSVSHNAGANFAIDPFPWLTSSLTLAYEASRTRALLGPTPTPTSTVGELPSVKALQSRSRRHQGSIDLSVNARFGRWTANLRLSQIWSRQTTRSDQGLGGLSSGDNMSGWNDALEHEPTFQTWKARSTFSRAELSITGQVATLPAGGAQITLRSDAGYARIVSGSSIASLNESAPTRSDLSVRGMLVLPIFSRAHDFVGELGEMSITGEYGIVKISNSTPAQNRRLALSWEPVPALRFQGSHELSRLTPDLDLLRAPMISTPGVRVFDALSGETSDVVQITGGNPSLRSGEATVSRLSAVIRPLAGHDLQVDVNHTDSHRTNFVSALPAASADIMQAFDERFLRDANGRLSVVDARPTNFLSGRTRTLSWGLSFSPIFRRASNTALSKSPSLQLSVTHSMILSDTITVRRGLGRLDLLGHGASGGGTVRHRVEGLAIVGDGPWNLRSSFSWMGGSRLHTKTGGASDWLRFSPVISCNLGLSADLARLYPVSRWAKGMRASLEVANLTPNRQRVQDSAGQTPLPYQPSYRNPLGVMVELGVRKVL